MKKFLPVIICSFLMILTKTAFAQSFTVNTTADTHAASPTTSPNDGSGNISIRSACEYANAVAGRVVTINIPAGTFILNAGTTASQPNTNTIMLGSFTQNVSLIGAGPVSTIIRMGTGTSQD